MDETHGQRETQALAGQAQSAARSAHSAARTLLQHSRTAQAARARLLRAGQKALGAFAKSLILSPVGLLVLGGVLLLIAFLAMVPGFGGSTSSGLTTSATISNPYTDAKKDASWNADQVAFVQQLENAWQATAKASAERAGASPQAQAAGGQAFLSWVPQPELLEGMISVVAPSAGITTKTLPKIEDDMMPAFSTVTAYALTTTVTTTRVVTPASLPGGGTHTTTSRTVDKEYVPTQVQDWNGTHSIAWGVTTNPSQTVHLVQTAKVKVHGHEVTETIVVTTTTTTQSLQERQVAWHEDFSQIAQAIRDMAAAQPDMQVTPGQETEEEVLMQAATLLGYPPPAAETWGQLTDNAMQVPLLLQRAQGSGMKWPIPSDTVVAGFGSHIDPLQGDVAYGYTDYMAQPTGMPVLAATAGKVQVGQSDVFGTFARIDNGPWGILVGNLGRVIVRSGQQVRQGEVIAYTGTSGSPGTLFSEPITQVAMYYAGQPVDPVAAWQDDLVSATFNANVYAGNDLWVPGQGDALVPFPEGGDAGCATEAVEGPLQAGQGGIPGQCLQQIFLAAGAQYQVSPFLLMAIADVESRFYRDAVGPFIPQYAGTPDAHAYGMMQFLPSTFGAYGSADANPSPTPYDPQDAVFAAAKMLAGDGAATNPQAAVFDYNHSQDYVNTVLNLAAYYQTAFGGQIAAAAGGD